MTKIEEFQVFAQFIQSLPEQSYLSMYLKGLEDYCLLKSRSDEGTSILEDMQDLRGHIEKREWIIRGLREQLQNMIHETIRTENRLKMAIDDLGKAKQRAREGID